MSLQGTNSPLTLPAAGPEVLRSDLSPSATTAYRIDSDREDAKMYTMRLLNPDGDAVRLLDCQGKDVHYEAELKEGDGPYTLDVAVNGDTYVTPALLSLQTPGRSMNTLQGNRLSVGVTEPFLARLQEDDSVKSVLQRRLRKKVKIFPKEETLSIKVLLYELQQRVLRLGSANAHDIAQFHEDIRRGTLQNPSIQKYNLWGLVQYWSLLMRKK